MTECMTHHFSRGHVSYDAEIYPLLLLYFSCTCCACDICRHVGNICSIDGIWKLDTSKLSLEDIRRYSMLLRLLVDIFVWITRANTCEQIMSLHDTQHSFMIYSTGVASSSHLVSYGFLIQKHRNSTISPFSASCNLLYSFKEHPISINLSYSSF